MVSALHIKTEERERLEGGTTQKTPRILAERSLHLENKQMCWQERVEGIPLLFPEYPQFLHIPISTYPTLHISNFNHISRPS